MGRGLGQVQRDLLRALSCYDGQYARFCLGTSSSYLAAAVFHPGERRWGTSSEERSTRRALARLLQEGYVAGGPRTASGRTYELTDKGRSALFQMPLDRLLYEGYLEKASLVQTGRTLELTPEGRVAALFRMPIDHLIADGYLVLEFQYSWRRRYWLTDKGWATLRRWQRGEDPTAAGRT